MNNYKLGTSFHKIYTTTNQVKHALSFDSNVAFKQTRKLSYLQPKQKQETSTSNTATSSNNVLSKSRLFEESLAAQLESMFRAFPNSDASLVKQQVRQIHAKVVVCGMNGSLTLGSRMLGMYVLCRSFKDVGNLFCRLQLCYSLPWNWLIRGFSMLGCFDFALMFFFRMLGSNVAPDKYTFPYVIKACGGLNNVPLCKMVHELSRSMGFHMDLFIGSSLIKLYTDNGYIHDAKYLFDELPVRDCILWNVMLNGYVKNVDFNSALETFQEMRNSCVKPNSVTFVCLLSVCATRGIVRAGIQLHGLVIRSGFESDPQLANTLITMYSKCGNLFDARKIFDMMPQTDTVTWNGLIAGYVQNGFTDEAVALFKAMVTSGVKLDSITFASFLPSVLKSGNLQNCKQIHGYIVRHGLPFDVYLKSALVDIYFKGGDVEMACKTFQLNTLVDVAVCTAMISGYVLNGLNVEALNLFSVGVPPCGEKFQPKGKKEKYKLPLAL